MAASTVFFVCFASSPPNVSSRSATNEELCSKRKSWSRESSQAATRIGLTCFADLRMRLYSFQYPGEGKELLYYQASNKNSSIEKLCKLKMITSNGSSRACRGKYPVVQRHSDYLKTCTRNHFGSSLRYVTDYPDINKVISGYWVGPDVEDGWGYAEAIVDQVL